MEWMSFASYHEFSFRLTILSLSLSLSLSHITDFRTKLTTNGKTGIPLRRLRASTISWKWITRQKYVCVSIVSLFVHVSCGWAWGAEHFCVFSPGGYNQLQWTSSFVLVSQCHFSPLERASVGRPLRKGCLVFRGK